MTVRYPSVVNAEKRWESYLVVHARHFGETSCLQALLLEVFLLDIKCISKLLSSFSVKLCPSLQDGRQFSRSVVTENLNVGFGGLDPTTWGATTICLLEEGSPIANSSKEITDVNEIKSVVSPGPCKGCIVNLKLDVGWDPSGLNRREVGTNHFGVGVLVCKVAMECELTSQIILGG